MQPITHSQLAHILDRLWPHRRPAFIQGSPGIGKTDSVYQWADTIDACCIAESAIHYDAVEVNGFRYPDVKSGYTIIIKPELIKRVLECKRKNVVIFFDDLTTSPPLVQAALYRMMLERRLGDQVLPDNVYVCAAGNRAIDAAAVNQMPTPLRNRMWHGLLEPNIEDWTKWALKSGIAAELIAFLRLRSDLLHVFNKNEYAFCTPRSWAFTSEQIDSFRVSPDPSIEHEVYSGFVGEAAATELMGFLRMFRNVNIDAILMAPQTAPVPDDPSARYAVAVALSRRATMNNFDSVTAYADRMPEEFGALCILTAYNRDKKLTQTTSFIKWAAKHQESFQ